MPPWKKKHLGNIFARRSDVQLIHWLPGRLKDTPGVSQRWSWCRNFDFWEKSFPLFSQQFRVSLFQSFARAVHDTENTPGGVKASILSEIAKLVGKIFWAKINHSVSGIPNNKNKPKIMFRFEIFATQTSQKAPPYGDKISFMSHIASQFLEILTTIYHETSGVRFLMA